MMNIKVPVTSETHAVHCGMFEGTLWWVSATTADDLIPLFH